MQRATGGRGLGRLVGVMGRCLGPGLPLSEGRRLCLVRYPSLRRILHLYVTLVLILHLHVAPALILHLARARHLYLPLVMGRFLIQHLCLSLSLLVGRTLILHLGPGLVRSLSPGVTVGRDPALAVTRVGEPDAAEVHGAAVAAGHLVRARLVHGLDDGLRRGRRDLVAPGALGAGQQEEVVVLGGGLGEVGVRVGRGSVRLLTRACVLRQSLARDLAGVGHAYPSPHRLVLPTTSSPGTAHRPPPQ